MYVVTITLKQLVKLKAKLMNDITLLRNWLRLHENVVFISVGFNTIKTSAS